jgi:hypothetical protein
MFQGRSATYVAPKWEFTFCLHGLLKVAPTRWTSSITTTLGFRMQGRRSVSMIESA